MFGDRAAMGTCRGQLQLGIFTSQRNRAALKGTVTRGATLPEADRIVDRVVTPVKAASSG